MTYLIDTNVISELRNRARADRKVIAWEASVEADSVFLSVITLLELEIGVLRVERRDRRQGAMLRKWLQSSVLPSFRGRVLPVNTEVAIRCARFHVPNPSPARDAFIAATALVHGMTVVTRNVEDFEPTGVPLLNPWEK